MTKVVFLFCLLNFCGLSRAVAQTGHFSLRDELGVAPDELIGGPRINYMQGNASFIGLAFYLGWHEVGYVPMKHFGFALGSDLRLSKSALIAPKFTAEYRYYFFLGRVGYAGYTDFHQRLDNRITTELGLTLYGFIDLTYMHLFGFSGNRYGLGNDYINFTVNLPLLMKTLPLKH